MSSWTPTESTHSHVGTPWTMCIRAHRQTENLGLEDAGAFYPPSPNRSRATFAGFHTMSSRPMEDDQRARGGQFLARRAVLHRSEMTRCATGRRGRGLYFSGVS